jgi:hypothetical protein
MINRIYQFGDQVKLNVNLNTKKLLEELEMFENSWSHYNPKKEYINRQGLCILNERGSCGPGPALDSIKEYNQINKTKWTEFDFNKPTEVYNNSEEIRKIMKDILPYSCRTHFLRLGPGGFFPPHRDHVRGEQKVFRLIVPIKNYNPHSFRFMIEDRTLIWDPGYMYAINTTKEHCLFNMGSIDSIWLVINTIINEESANFVAENLCVG